MLKEALWRIIQPVCTLYALVRYGGFWSLRAKLHESPRRSPILERVYKDHLARKGAWIGYRAKIASKPVFPHDVFGVFISDNAVIGANCVIFQQVTIGSETQADSKFRGSPVIGDNVYLGAGAKVIGGIRVGDNCRIGANTTVSCNLPDNTLVVCAPPRKVRLERLDNTFSRG